MKSQPMICVKDVEASSHWYQAVLGCRSGHGGPEYEQLVFEDRLLLQLHDWDPEEHPELGRAADAPPGHGVSLWFETPAFDAAVARAQAARAQVVTPPHVNPRAQHREIWLRDPDGYLVVIASPYGDVG